MVKASTRDIEPFQVLAADLSTISLSKKSLTQCIMARKVGKSYIKSKEENQATVVFDSLMSTT